MFDHFRFFPPPQTTTMIDWDEWRRYWHKRMPILDWLPTYNLQRDLKFDLIAGFTVAVMIVPQEMSLAALMGVPAQYGLYTAATAPLLYPLFGSSRALSVANAAEGSLLVGVMLRAAEIQTVEERVATGILLTFFAGLVMICSGFLHQGGVVSFFSRSSMNGYITATAFLIVTSQLPGWLGIVLHKKAPLTIFTLIEILSEVPQTNGYSLVLGIFSMAFLSITKKLKGQLHGVKPDRNTSDPSIVLPTTPTVEQDEDDDIVDIALHHNDSSLDPPPKLADKATSVDTAPTSRSHSRVQVFFEDKPLATLVCSALCDGGALIVCIVGMAVGASLGDDAIKLTGVVPSGLPMPVFPPGALGGLIPVDRLQTIISNAAMIAAIFFMSSVATGSKLANKDGYEISPNQELLGLGFANLGSSFFQGMPSTAGLSRSAVNSQSAHTPLASMFTAVLVIFTLLFLTGPLYFLPQAPLAAIIILSAITLIDFSEPKWLRVVNPHDFAVWLASFAGTLVFGLLSGLMMSIAASLVAIMAKSKKPRVFTMGQLPDGSFADAEVPNSAARELLDVVIVRMNHALYFGNSSHFIHGMERRLQAAKARSRIVGVIVDGSRMNGIDASAIHALKEYHQKLQARDQQLTFANLQQETATSLLASGIWKESESERALTGDVNAAIAFLRRPYI